MNLRFEIFPHRIPSDDDVSEINGLMRQLSPHAPRASKEDVLKVVFRAYLITARDIDAPRNGGYRIVGMVTLVEKLQLAGFFGSVEDVVVDEAYRGNGIAERLNLFLIDIATMLGMKHLDLTSNPARIAANKLYDKLGYVDRDTRTRRLTLQT